MYRLPKNIMPLLQIFIAVDLATRISLLENLKPWRTPGRKPWSVGPLHPGAHEPDGARNHNSNDQ
jgi:hypothetical protein